MTMRRLSRICALATAIALPASLGGARADDTLKIAIGQYGNWENSAPELGQRIYPKDELMPERLAGLEAITEEAIAFKYLKAPLKALFVYSKEFD
jgi:hypothetical protein